MSAPEIRTRRLRIAQSGPMIVLTCIAEDIGEATRLYDWLIEQADQGQVAIEFDTSERADQ
jgi:hypothetical protein